MRQQESSGDKIQIQEDTASYFSNFCATRHLDVKLQLTGGTCKVPPGSRHPRQLHNATNRNRNVHKL